MSGGGFDSVVVGGGLAGLSCAAHLARAGRKVVVIEQHARPGGYCTSFVRRGITFDPGPHWTVDADGINDTLTALGGQPLTFTPLESIFRALGPGEGTDIRLSKDWGEFRNTVCGSFPGASEDSLARLIALSLEIDQEMDGMPSENLELASFLDRVLMGVRLPLKLRRTMKYGRMSVAQVLGSLFPGDDLRDLRAALHMLVPMVDAPATALFAFLAIGLTGRGVSLVGGAQKVTEALAEAVVRNGGQILCSKRVSEIKVHRGRAVGVVLEDGSELDAGCVVAAIDARQTFYELVDPACLPAKFKRRLGGLVAGSWFTVSIVADIDPARFGFDGGDVFVSSSSDFEEMLASDDPDKLSFRVTFPTLIDPAHRDKEVGQHTHGIQIAAPASFEFENHWRTGPGFQRGKEYQELKQAFAFKLIRRLEKYIPALGAHIQHLDVSTPITYYRYTLNHGGSGLGWRDFGLWKQRVPFIRGLYRAGMWVGGMMIPGAIASGKTAAELVLRDG